MKDIEALLVEYLSETLDIPVAADVPEVMPDEFISLERTGGQFNQMVLDNPSVAIQVWSTSRASAKNRAYEVDRLVRAMTDVYTDVVRADRNSLYNFPDPGAKKARYQIVFDFIIQE